MKACREVFCGLATLAVVGFCPVSRGSDDAKTETLYFLMRGFGDPDTAFVVGFEDAELVAHVRAVLQGESDQRWPMVPAMRYPEEGERLSEIWPADRLRPPRPVFRADGINRNYFAPSTPAWSWHLDEVVQFGFGCLNCFVLNAPRAEEIAVAIKTDPEQLGLQYLREMHVMFNPLMELGPALSLRFLEHEGQEYVIWVGVGIGYVYTLESTDDPVRGEWAPVPGGDWPLDVVRWPIDRSEPGSRFYRVRAEQLADPGE